MSSTKYDPLLTPKSGPKVTQNVTLDPLFGPYLSTTLPRSTINMDIPVKLGSQKWPQNVVYILHFRTPFSPYFHIPPNTPKIHSHALMSSTKIRPTFWPPKRGTPKVVQKWSPLYQNIGYARLNWSKSCYGQDSMTPIPGTPFYDHFWRGVVIVPRAYNAIMG